MVKGVALGKPGQLNKSRARSRSEEKETPDRVSIFLSCSRWHVVGWLGVSVHLKFRGAVVPFQFPRQTFLPPDPTLVRPVRPDVSPISRTQ